MEKEIWKDIEGYEELYAVSNLGNIKRLVFINNNTKKIQERNVTTSDNGKGYKLFSFSKDGKRKNFYIHRLVALAFIPNTQNKKEINHIDGDKSNNRVDNLEWATRSENMMHAYKNNLKKTPMGMLGRIGVLHPMSIPVKMYDLDNNFIKCFESASIASKVMNICCASIKKCRVGKQRTAGGYIWKY